MIGEEIHIKATAAQIRSAWRGTKGGNTSAGSLASYEKQIRRTISHPLLVIVFVCVAVALRPPTVVILHIFCALVDEESGDKSLCQRMVD
jgi:glycerol-3-phosphate acyltransferase PlsY